MKRFLFLVCGAALLLIAGGRFLVLLGGFALMPENFRATAQVQFADNTPLPQLSDCLSATVLSSLVKTPKFVEQLMLEKFHTAKLTEAEAIQWIQRSTIIESDPTHRSILLTFQGDVPENTVFVANGLARALAERNSPSATALPATAALGFHPPLAGFFKSPHVYIPLLVTLAGAMIFFLGWRMATTLINNLPTTVVVPTKY